MDPAFDSSKTKTHIGEDWLTAIVNVQSVSNTGTIVQRLCKTFLGFGFKKTDEPFDSLIENASTRYIFVTTWCGDLFTKWSWFDSRYH